MLLKLIFLLTTFRHIHSAKDSHDEYLASGRHHHNKTKSRPSGMFKNGLPIDAFTLHHPFHQTSITEFEYSKWYFLFFVLSDSNKSTDGTTFVMDSRAAVFDIANSLASKLSVSSSVFAISKVESYKLKRSISANLSLTNLTVPKLHHNLCALQNVSPIFEISGSKFQLIQVIHDKNQHKFVRNYREVIIFVFCFFALVSTNLLKSKEKF